MSSLRAAVIGVGHLGKHHARILGGLPGVEMVAAVDSVLERAEAAVAAIPGARLMHLHHNKHELTWVRLGEA